MHVGGTILGAAVTGSPDFGGASDGQTHGEQVGLPYMATGSIR